MADFPWDVKLWGTRGPPWRYRLLHPNEPIADSSQIGTKNGPDWHGAVERMAQRMVDHSKRVEVVDGEVFKGSTKPLTIEDAREFVKDGPARRIANKRQRGG